MSACPCISLNIIRDDNYDTTGKLTNSPILDLDIPLGFAGGLYDRHTNLTRFGYRDYDPHTGRWTAKDPIDFNGGQSNLYVYVGNDPVNWVDPLGLWTNGYKGNDSLMEEHANKAYNYINNNKYPLAKPYLVFAHGDAKGNGRMQIGNEIIGAQGLADKIGQDPDFKANPRPVHLFICNSGTVPDSGDDPLGQQLAGILKQPVTAYNGLFLMTAFPAFNMPILANQITFYPQR